MGDEFDVRKRRVETDNSRPQDMLANSVLTITFGGTVRIDRLP